MTAPGSPPRPRVSVIVPFAGDRGGVHRLIATLERLQLRDGDELIVAENSAVTATVHPLEGPARVCPAGGVRAAGFARNRGAAVASGEWLVFIDADTVPMRSLLDAYFDPMPGARVGVLAGEIHDVAEAGTRVARYTAGRGQMEQRVTLERRGTPYAQTANCAVRRTAFEAVGGFNDSIRFGEDADLCFRLLRAGWELEARRGAAVEHQARASLSALLRQLVGHGSGAAWLERAYPGEFPPPPPRAVAARLARGAGAALGALARRDSDAAASALLELLTVGAYDLGRLRSNRARGT